MIEPNGLNLWESACVEFKLRVTIFPVLPLLLIFSKTLWMLLLINQHTMDNGEFKTYDATTAKCLKFCIFNEQKQNLCTPFMCFFHSCTFLSRSWQIWNVKWPFLKFCRERKHTHEFEISFLALRFRPFGAAITDIMTRKIDKRELAILSDVFGTVTF